jgi:TPR repeat protein
MGVFGIYLRHERKMILVVVATAVLAGCSHPAASITRTKAMTGDREAQYTLGRWYATLEGEPQGIRQNLTEAAKWLRKSADQRYAPAQSLLGMLYEKGLGVPKDYAEAGKLYRKAAEQGIVSAQSALGVLYSTGQGMAQDKKQAAVWFQKAAEQGDAEAQYNLGLAYQNGEGVAQDRHQALMWLNLAARRLAKVTKARDQLALQMTLDERARAESAANTWQKR